MTPFYILLSRILSFPITHTLPSLIRLHRSCWTASIFLCSNSKHQFCIYLFYFCQQSFITGFCQQSCIHFVLESNNWPVSPVHTLYSNFCLNVQGQFYVSFFNYLLFVILFIPTFINLFTLHLLYSCFFACQFTRCC